jgi:hypothetical protein
LHDLILPASRISIIQLKTQNAIFVQFLRSKELIRWIYRRG